jgi:hypothetical protein
MGLRPSKSDEDISGADPWTRSSGFVDFPIRPTRASAADQGFRPTYVFNGALRQVPWKRSVEDAGPNLPTAPTPSRSRLSNARTPHSEPRA